MIQSRLSHQPKQEGAYEARVHEEAQVLGRRVGENTLWLLLARLGTQGLMVLFTLVIARHLGEVGLGAYSFMTAVVFLGNVVTTFGTDTLIIREVSAKGNIRILPSALVLQLLLSALFVSLVFLSAPVLPNQNHQAVRALQLFSLALFPMSFYTVFSATLRGYERMDSFMWLNLSIAIFQVGLIWLFLHPRSSLVRLAWLLLGAQTAVALLAALLCLTQIPGFRLAWRTSNVAIPALLRISAPIALLGLLKVLYQRASVFMLSTMLGAAATGWFSAALRTVEASQIGHIALLGALFPVMVQVYMGREDEARIWTSVLSISWRLLLALGGGTATILFLLAPVLVKLLYGPYFEPAIPALRVLAWILIPYSVNIYLSSQLLSANNERLVAHTFLVSLLVLAGLNVWLIPHWGLFGACLATLTAEVTQAALFLYLRKHHFREISKTSGGL